MVACALAVLPNAGLANKLFVWAKSEVFAELNGIPARSIGWGYPKVGAFLRGERSLRMYGKFFRGLSLKDVPLIAAARAAGPVNYEPDCGAPDQPSSKGLYVFRDMPHWRDLFSDLREHRAFLRSKLGETIRHRFLEELGAFAAPVIAVHIRRGDFRALRPDEDFAKVGGVRTPTSYFLSIVERLRLAAGVELPVTIFSDGSDDELRDMLALKNVARSQAKHDIQDLLLMSRAKIIVTSAGSTFSDWAGFVSEAAIIRHPDHIHAPIRSPHEGLHEGPPPTDSHGWHTLLRRVRLAHNC